MSRRRPEWLSRAPGKFLFVVRAAEPAKGKLGLPGGFVDPGESGGGRASARVREEIGAEIDEPVFLASFPEPLWIWRDDLPHLRPVFPGRSAD